MQDTHAPTRSAGAVALTVTRVLAALMAALILVQGTLGGSHLTGDRGALDIHRTLGTDVLPWLALAVVVAAMVAVRHSRWVVAVAVPAAVGTGTQIGMGFQGRLQVHFPLGLALFGAYLAIALAARDRTKEER